MSTKPVNAICTTSITHTSARDVLAVERLKQAARAIPIASTPSGVTNAKPTTTNTSPDTTALVARVNAAAAKQNEERNATTMTRPISYSRPHMAEPDRAERCAALIAGNHPALANALGQVAHPDGRRELNIVDVVTTLAARGKAGAAK